MSTSQTPKTSCGLPQVGDVPWGSHFCHFYIRRHDLVSAVVPFFRAGLENGERCLWITAPPLPEEEAKAELARAVPDLQARIDRGDIVVRDYDGWYTSGQQARGEAVVAEWLREEERARAAGCAGLRISGNTSFLTEQTWGPFLDYERAVTRAFQGRRILALCSYSLVQCRDSDVFDVVKTHPWTLDGRDGGWDVVETAGRRLR